MILKKEIWGILSVTGDQGYPYGVPVNYGYRCGKIYIHSTNGSSHKLDSIRRNPKVCLTVVGKQILDADHFTTHYESVIVFGTARIIEDEPSILEATMRMMDHLAPSTEQAVWTHCKNLKKMVMIEITPEHITGKCRK